MRLDDPGPYSLDVLATLSAPALFTRDAKVLRDRYVVWFEAASGRTLYPMQAEMLLIETLAHAMSLIGEEAQLAVEQGLVVTAQGENLDALGPNRSTQRLPAAHALTTLRFSPIGVLAANVVLATGVVVTAGGGVDFETTSPAILRPGAPHVDVPARAVVAGVSGNGFLAGQIATLVSPVSGASVENITASAGGADIEAHQAYRLRMANAFDRVSSGGGYGWYRETAMGVSSAMIDCGVVRPQPCYINLYPLTFDGAAGADLRAAVLAAFETARALENRFGDLVSVLPPAGVSRTVVLTVRCKGAAATIKEDAEDAAGLLLSEWRQRLAALVSPHDLAARVRKLAGVVDVDVAGLPFEQLGEHQFLDASATVNIEWID